MSGCFFANDKKISGVRWHALDSVRGNFRSDGLRRNGSAFRAQRPRCRPQEDSAESEEEASSAAKADRPAIVSEKPQTAGDPVGVQLKVSEGEYHPGHSFEVSVVLRVAPGYEIHDLDSPPPTLPTRLDLELPAGFRALGEWSVPEPVRSQMPDGHPVYMGEAAFTRKVGIADNVEPGQYRLNCSIRYQACNIRQCLAPKECHLSAAVSVQP
jgi:hypothetical protein